jgi:hypothetical protein
MPCSGTFRSVALVRTDVSEELRDLNIYYYHPDYGGSKFLRNVRVTRRNIPEDGILPSHRRKNLKSYTALTGWTL